MKKSKRTERTLIASAIALLLCFVMLLGTTFAWFTDTAETDVNVIQTGKLKLTFEHSNYNNGNPLWADASSKKLFDYKDWEPGYTALQYVRLTNVGTLDFDYKLKLMATDAAIKSKLAGAIEVYVFDHVATSTELSRDGLNNQNANYRGKLSEVMAADYNIYEGILYNHDANDTTQTNHQKICTIVLKMPVELENDYQELSVEGGFTVKVFATQAQSESDSLGDDYDTGATYPS